MLMPRMHQLNALKKFRNKRQRKGMQEILVYNTRTIMPSFHFGTSFMIFEESLLATLLFYPMDC